MSIPGTSMEQDTPVHELDPNAPPQGDQDDDADGLVETVKVGEQQMAPISEVIKYRKQAKALQRQVAELQPQIDNARAIGQRLQEVQPILDRLQQMTPQQREALAHGRTPSPEGTYQPAEDVEARELAEDMGLIAADGSLDIARARRRLDKDNARFDRRMQEVVGPIRQSSAAQQASAIRQQAYAITDPNGDPLASQESINEAYALLPPELAAQPNVAMVAIGTAMLIDKMRNRTPKAATPGYGAPIYSEPTAGRRSAASGVSPEARSIAAKVGLSDKDLSSAVDALRNSGRGVRME